MERKETRVVRVGSVRIGGQNPISIQSMNNTDTRDAAKTLEQIGRLAEAGCDGKAGQYREAVVTVAGDHIRAELVGGPVLEVQDTTFAKGGIGLLADQSVILAFGAVELSVLQPTQTTAARRARANTVRRVRRIFLISFSSKSCWTVRTCCRPAMREPTLRTHRATFEPPYPRRR